MAVPTQSVLLAAASSQYFTRTDTASLSITGDFTFECLIKPTSLPGVGGRTWVARKFAADGSNVSWMVNIQNIATVQTLYMRIDNSSSATSECYSSLGTFNTGTWYHIAGVFTAAAGGNKVVLYKDGTALTAISPMNGASSMRDADTDTRIGIGGTGFEEYLDARLSMMRLWAEARTAGQLNNCTILGATTNLAAEWTLNNTANDNSGNSNTLTPVNTPTYAADVSGICVGGTTSVNLALLGAGT